MLYLFPIQVIVLNFDYRYKRPLTPQKYPAAGITVLKLSPTILWKKTDFKVLLLTLGVTIQLSN